MKSGIGTQHAPTPIFVVESSHFGERRGCWAGPLHFRYAAHRAVTRESPSTNRKPRDKDETAFQALFAL